MLVTMRILTDLYSFGEPFGGFGDESLGNRFRQWANRGCLF